MKPQPPSCLFEVSGPHAQARARNLFNHRLFALVAPLALVLAVIGLSSCAGYTSAAAQSQTPGSGILSASSTSLNFGSVSVGGNSTQSVSVTNTGTATVNISQATILGTGFT